MTDDCQLLLGDCLERMGEIADGSVDLIAADLPYGTTACKWDTVIPFELLWAHFRRVLKPRGAVVLTASQPFTSMLVMSNPKWFKYCWVWDKALAGNPLNAPFQPMKIHEDVCIFSPSSSTYSPRGGMTYHPQMEAGEPYVKTNKIGVAKQIFRSPIKTSPCINPSGERYPSTIIRFSNAARNKPHPTQKPVALFEYLISTYSNEGETVLDPTFGSGTTGLACINTGRKFIGIEKDPIFFEIARKRLATAQRPLIAV